MPTGPLNCPSPEPLMPAWQLAATVQVSNVLAPVATPNPQARMKLPEESNFCTRRLLNSATYTFPEESVVIPVAKLNAPPVEAWAPGWQTSPEAAVQMLPPVLRFTPLPHVSTKFPSESNFCTRCPRA